MLEHWWLKVLFIGFLAKYEKYGTLSIYKVFPLQPLNIIEQTLKLSRTYFDLKIESLQISSNLKLIFKDSKVKHIASNVTSSQNAVPARLFVVISRE